MINFILIIALGTTAAPTIVHRKTRQTQGNRSIGFAAVIDFTNFQIPKDITYFSWIYKCYIWMDLDFHSLFQHCTLHLNIFKNTPQQ